MDYGGYISIAVLLVAGIFFIIALFCRTKIQVLKFTAYGFITLAILGLVFMGLTNSKDLVIAVILFVALSVIYLWFYRGSLKDELKGKD